MNQKSSVREYGIFFLKHTFNRTNFITPEREKITPRAHAKIKGHLDIWKEKVNKSSLRTQVDFVKRVSCSTIPGSESCRCFSSQPDKWWGRGDFTPPHPCPRLPTEPHRFSGKESVHVFVNVGWSCLFFFNHL